MFVVEDVQWDRVGAIRLRAHHHRKIGSGLDARTAQ